MGLRTETQEALRVIWLPGQPHPPYEEGLETPVSAFLTDYLRSVFTFAGLAAAQPLLARAPHGDGHPVVVLPGFGAGDFSTVPMRRFLTRLGYRTFGWGLGFNIGPTRRALDGLGGLITEIADTHEQKVSIVGWSLGGVFARSVARSRPEDIRQVITLGSPFNMRHPRQARATAIFARFNRWHIPTDELPDHDLIAGPLPVPSTAIYSKLDGMCNWRTTAEATVGPNRENIAVYSSHLGFGHDPAVMWAVADRLAQVEGQWAAFEAPGCARALYPSPQPAEQSAGERR